MGNLVLKLQTPEPFQKFRFKQSSIYLIGLLRLLYSCNLDRFQLKKKSRITLELELKSTQYLGT